MINDLLMRSIQNKQPNAQGQMEINQNELVFEISKFDDTLYMEDGFRKEEIERAIEVYGLDNKEAAEQKEAEEERRAMMQMMLQQR